MNFSDFAVKRYSVRNFVNKQIEAEEMNKILQAGLLAPTACNRQYRIKN